MNKTVSLSKLKDNLFSTPDECCRKRSAHLSGGGKYLYETLFLPLLRGETLNFGDLDFGKFDCDDISDLYNFYRSCEDDIGRLSSMSAGLDNLPSRVCPVSFI